MGLRRKSRELVLQALYSQEMENSDDVAVLSTQKSLFNYIAENGNIEQDSTVFTFAEEVYSNTLQNIVMIDDIIKKHLKNWKLEDLNILDKNIIRIAVCEMLIINTPHPVAINEAVELAKKYCSEQTRSFINGVLDIISKYLTTEE